MFLDIGLSFIYVVLLGRLLNVDLQQYHVFISIAFALLPDVDVPVELFQRKKLSGKVAGFHQKYTHFPLLYLPLAVAIFILFGSFFGLLFLANIISHFLHDSFWTGWGIKWLWPFSTRNYKFFSNDRGELAFKLVTSWSNEETSERMKALGDDEWFKHVYLQLNPVIIVEALILLVGLLLLLFYF